MLLLRNSDWSRAFVADALEFLTNKEKQVSPYAFWQCDLATADNLVYGLQSQQCSAAALSLGGLQIQ